MAENSIYHSYLMLLAAHPALPREMSLTQIVVDAKAAQDRGYYLPDEDERLREVYVTYLGVRASLWEMVLALRPQLREENLVAFGVAFCAAAMLVRSGSYVIELARPRPVVWKKLDEAEPRYGLPWKSFTRVYRNLCSVRWTLRFQMALSYYRSRRAELHEALTSAGMPEVVDFLIEEEPFLESRRRDFLKRRLVYRWYSLFRRSRASYRRVMFQLFRLGGSAIAEMKDPFQRRTHKRVTKKVLDQAREHLAPGDVIVTRHEDAMSNLFLPGYWPHAALYLGAPDADVLEAKKDGVRLRPLEETLAVDAFVILRPRLNPDMVAQALKRGREHEGKPYDFVFDFRGSERLVCTEVVYRSYHGIGAMNFELTMTSGRLVLSAEDLISQALEKQLFETIACFGVEETPFLKGAEAQQQLLKSLDRGR